MTPAWQLLASEHAALEILDLREQRDRYRLLLQLALAELHAALDRERRHREQHQQLSDEYRSLRERMMRGALREAA